MKTASMLNMASLCLVLNPFNWFAMTITSFSQTRAVRLFVQYLTLAAGIVLMICLEQLAPRRLSLGNFAAPSWEPL